MSLIKTSFGASAKRKLTMAAVLMLATSSLAWPALALPDAASPQRGHVTAKPKPPVPREDILLIMPNASADQDELSESLKAVNGEIIGEMGSGTTKILLVKTEHGKADATERKLSADRKNFNLVNANHKIYANYIPTNPDPAFGKSWHLSRMHCPEAWDSIGARVVEPIAVFDTGCQIYGSDLNGIASHGADVSGEFKDFGKLMKFFTLFGGQDLAKLDTTIQGIGNRIEVLSMGMFDKHGHGTGVATAACGQQNDKASCGVNPKAQVFPIKISDGKAGGPAPSDDLAMTAAMMVMYQKGIRIINISYGPLMEQSEHRVLHAMFRDWFERKDGLVFISAGNAGEKLGSRDEAYINVVSAMGKVDNEMVLANNGMWSSASGPCIDFTAPGQGIQCASPSGRSISMDGTSLSTPLCSAVASLIWTVNPRLKNTQVIEIMRLACVNTTVGRNNKFGYGMPDAARAVKIAEASR